MRWICKDDIEECLSQEWRNSANDAKAALLQAETAEDRKALLKKLASSKIWRDFYELLPLSLKKKCWYCEAEDIRSDMPVDHFRPKNKVDDERNHDGYWWLAFDWTNYRCACTYCNSRRNFEETQGGKACRFPLTLPGLRAYTQDDDHTLETPNFLDPFEPDDWKLLWFDNDGLPEPIPGASQPQKQKVENSVDIFHLHEARIVRQRNRIRLDIEKHIKAFHEATATNNENSQREIKNHLRKMVRDTEKFSRAAIVYLRQHRELSIVKEILQLD